MYFFPLSSLWKAFHNVDLQINLYDAKLLERKIATEKDTLIEISEYLEKQIDSVVDNTQIKIKMPDFPEDFDFEGIVKPLRERFGLLSNSNSQVAIIEENLEDPQRNLTKNEVEKFNIAMPSQKIFDIYNGRMTEYVKKARNKLQTSSIIIRNNGTISANQIIVELVFPPELYVYDDYEINTNSIPDPLEFPLCPLTKRKKSAVTRYLRSSGGRDVRRAKSRDYSINNNCIRYNKNKLLHTQSVESNKFYIVATMRGIFQIEGSLICEEFSEPLKKVFTITVE